MQTTFAEVLDAVDKLPTQDKEELIRILQNRLRDDGRERILQSIKESESEFKRGLCKVMTADEIMQEILS